SSLSLGVGAVVAWLTSEGKSFALGCRWPIGAGNTFTGPVVGISTVGACGDAGTALVWAKLLADAPMVATMANGITRNRMASLHPGELQIQRSHLSASSCFSHSYPHGVGGGTSRVLQSRGCGLMRTVALGDARVLCFSFFLMLHLQE